MSANYSCDIEECHEDAYPLTFEAKQTLIRLNPHLVLCDVIKPEHLCLECMEALTYPSCPLFLDDSDWIDIECCSNCKHYAVSFKVGVNGRCELDKDNSFSVTSNYSCRGYER